MAPAERWSEVLSLLTSHPTIDRAFTLVGTYVELCALINGIGLGLNDDFLSEFHKWLVQGGAEPTVVPYVVLVLHGSGISIHPDKLPLTEEQDVVAMRLLLEKLTEFASRSRRCV